MLTIQNTEVFGWEAAIRGARNPMNSWEKSDSNFSCKECDGCIWEKDARVETEESEDWVDTISWCPHSPCRIGENDLKLLKNLAKAGSDHGKYLRMITVQVDITAPLYWWKEFDTYKVGTVANSCSTMHKIHAKPFTLDDFSHEHLTYYEEEGELCRDWLGDLEDLINDLNFAREKFIETKDKKYWWQIIQLLPTSYNQKRTVQLTYAVLRNQYPARKPHKLDEWHTYCDWIESLPYAKEFIIVEE